MTKRDIRTFLQTKGELCIDTIPRELLENDRGNWRKAQNPNKFRGDMEGHVIGKRVKYEGKDDIVKQIDIWEEEMRKTSVVYLAYCDGYYKIGRSKNPSMRINTMDTGSPHGVELFDIIEGVSGTLLEKQLHNALNNYNHKGEWFDLEKRGAIKVLNRVLEDEGIQRRYHVNRESSKRPLLTKVNV